MAEILNSNSELNSVFRYGGEEFVIICNNCDTKQAALLAEKVRCIVEIDGLISESKLTISLGVSQYIHAESVEDWIHRVDTALYEAKRNRRNAVYKVENHKISATETN